MSGSKPFVNPLPDPSEHPVVTILKDNPALAEYICRLVGGKPEDAKPLLEGKVTKNLRKQAKFFRNLDL